MIDGKDELCRPEILLHSFGARLGFLASLMSYSWSFCIAVAVITAVGGALAQVVASGRMSWWAGGLMATYGTLVGTLLFGVLGEELVLRALWPGNLWVGTLIACGVVGGVSGALIGGWAAKV